MSIPAQYRKPLEQAVYLVMVRVRTHSPDQPNVDVIGAKLRKRDADFLCTQVPGSWVEKVIATKP